MTVDPQINTFWTVNVGHIITLVGMLIPFWLAHQANLKRMDEQARVSAKLEAIMSTKLDLIYSWFCNNVVGRGEPPRHKSAGESATEIPPE